MKENVNGTEICYRIEGEGENKVLLLHGWGCDMKLMQPVADALKTDHRTLMVDFPGHGESGRPPEPWGVPEYAECLEELLDRTGFTPCSVIAHSFGCRVAAWIAANDPERFDRMVFTGAAGIRPKPTEESAKRSAEFKRLKGYCNQVKKIPFLKGTAEHWEEISATCIHGSVRARCSSGVTRTRKRRCGWGERWKSRSRTPAWSSWRAGPISPTWSRFNASTRSANIF